MKKFRYATGLVAAAAGLVPQSGLAVGQGAAGLAKSPGTAPVQPPLITLVDNAALNNGGSYTPVAGSNRLLLWMLGGNWTTTGGLQTGAVAGAQAYTKQNENLTSLDTVYLDTLANYIKEASIPVGSSINTITYSAAPTTNNGWVFTFSGVDQTNPIRGESIFSSVTNAQDITFANVAAVAGDMAVVVAMTSGVNFPAGPSGYTQVLNHTGSNPRVYVGYKAITADGNENPTFSVGTNITRRLGYLVVLKALVNT